MKRKFKICKKCIKFAKCEGKSLEYIYPSVDKGMYYRCHAEKNINYDLKEGFINKQTPVDCEMKLEHLVLKK